MIRLLIVAFIGDNSGTASVALFATLAILIAFSTALSVLPSFLSLSVVGAVGLVVLPDWGMFIQPS
jgi:hypothetical protein